MVKIKEFIRHVGYCNHTPFWSDGAVVGFFTMGISLGVILGLSLSYINPTLNWSKILFNPLKEIIGSIDIRIIKHYSIVGKKNATM